jgi:hypothetical protein
MAPVTEALREILRGATDGPVAEDLIFLETWERAPQPGSCAALRVSQLRRANPALAAAIRSELKHRRSSN